MGRLIDADVLREEVNSWGMNDYEPSDFTDAIDDAPTVEATPKADYEARFKTGKWIVHRKSDGEVGYFQCTSCDHHSVVKFPYCPICGAEMDCNPNILSEMKAIPKDQYENRLKADLVAMLTEIQLEIHELWDNDTSYIEGVHDSEMVIQQKIESLKGVAYDI